MGLATRDRARAARHGYGTRTALVAVALAACSAAQSLAGTVEVLAGGVVRTPADGTSAGLAVDASFVAGPYDSILVSVWTEEGPEGQDYDLADDLTFTLTADTPDAAYRKGFTWVRARDWDNEAGNPDSDAAGGAAWSYGYVAFGRGGLSAASPWYAGVVEPVREFRDGAWLEASGPLAYADRLHHLACRQDGSLGYPVARWSNPTGARAAIRVTGTLKATWGAQGGADVHCVVAHSALGDHALNIVWELDRRLRRVEAVYPHPGASDRVAVVADGSIVATADGGATWEPVEAGGARRATWLAFDPSTDAAIYAATEDAGVWRLGDPSGARRVGSAASGMASDRTCALVVSPLDDSTRTLMALHGDEAPGISVTEDGGAHWRVVAARFHAHAMAFERSRDGRSVFMVAATVDEPAVTSIWWNAGVGEHWLEIKRDVVPTGAAMGLARPSLSFWSTSDAGLLRFEATSSGVLTYRAGPPDVSAWACVGVTPGPRPRSEVVYAYEPRTRGLVVSEDGFATYSAHSRGLYVGPYVKDGAHVRANANGTTYYAAVNGQLYVGAQRSTGIRVTRATCAPARISFRPGGYLSARQRVFEAVRDIRDQRDAGAVCVGIVDQIEELRACFTPQRLRVSAVVEADGKDVAGVTVDLGGVRGRTGERMYDDGAHGDGAAGDGVYAVEVPLAAGNAMPDRWDRRRDLGVNAQLWVTAVARASLASAPALLTGFALPETIAFWREGELSTHEPQGAVEVTAATDPGAAREGAQRIVLSAGPGAWRVSLGVWHRRYDIAGYASFAFWLKCDAAAAARLRVQLSDFPENTLPVATPALAVGEFASAAGAGGYAWVVVPLERMREGATGFQPGLTTFVVFSGEGDTRSVYEIDDVRFFAGDADRAAYRERMDAGGAR